MNRPLLAALILALSASHAADAQATDTLAPVNLVDLRERLVQSYPSNSVFGILNKRKKGFEINLDGRATYVALGARTDLRMATSVNRFDENEICRAPSGSWSGGCLRMFRGNDGYLCEVVFGNGRGRDFPCGLVVVK
ncbi:MAG: hypothetical protein QNJ44_16850 [Rhodobacter sp.]|nr:hypothetical protein [Rhodobacter sp.]